MLALVAAFTAVIPASARAQSPDRPCAERRGEIRVDPVLRPHDEGESRPDFAAFRTSLRDTVRRQDTAALMTIVHPDIRVSFGGDEGPQSFRDIKVDGEPDFWSEFGSILAMGGRFTDAVSFDAPYVFSNWPGAFEPFECVAAVGSGVRVRQRPELSSPVIARLTFNIVQALEEPTRTGGWQRVRLADGRIGFVDSRLVRSPIAHRALFRFESGRWWLVAYLAGD